MTGPLLGSYIALWVFVGLQFVAIIALYHHFGRLYLVSPEGRQDQGPAVTSKIKPLAVPDTYGTVRTIPKPGTALLMVFVSTTCPICEKLRVELCAFSSELARIPIVLICAGEGDAVLKWAMGLAPSIGVIPDPRRRISADYDIHAIPFCVGVGQEGVVRAKGLVNDRQGLELALRETLEEDRASTVTRSNVSHVRGAIP